MKMQLNGIPTELCPPENCPHCGNKLVVEGAFPLCENFNCLGRIYGRLQKFVDVLDIKGAGDETLRGLAQRGFTTPGDLYEISEEVFCKLERKGAKHYQKFVEGLELRKEVSTAEFFAALDIEGRGSWEAITAIPGLQTIQEVLNVVNRPNVEEAVAMMSKAVRISPEKAANIIKEIRARMPEVQKLQSKMVQKVSGSKLIGKTFCITGALSEPRSMIERKIKDLGGQVSSSVSSRVTFLVTNEASDSSKARKAAQLGISTINEKQLREMMG